VIYQIYLRLHYHLYFIFNFCSKLATTSTVQLGIMPNCIMWIRLSGYCATSRMQGL